MLWNTTSLFASEQEGREDVCIRILVCVCSESEGCWRTAQAGAGLGFRSVQGYHYWPPCCVSATPSPQVLTYNPQMTPVRAEPGQTGPSARDPLQCHRGTGHTNKYTHTICCLLYPTPSVGYCAPWKAWRNGRGWGTPRKKTNTSTESEWGLGVDKKRPAGRFSGMSTPYASSSCLKHCLPRLTVNQVR